MARRRKRKSSPFLFEHGLSKKTLHAVYGVAFFASALFFGLAAWDSAGVAGEKTHELFTSLLGLGYFLLPALALVLGIVFIRPEDEDGERQHVGWIKLVGSTLFFLSGLALLEMSFTGTGGLVGRLISVPVLKLFDVYAGIIFVSALFLISLLVLFNTHIRLPKFILRWFGPKEDTADEDEFEEDEKEEYEYEEEDDDYDDDTGTPSLATRVAQKFKKPDESDPVPPPPIMRYTDREYVPPPLSLLGRDKGKPGTGDIKGNANIIKRTLQNFGIDVELDEISIGPSVTRYAIKPAEGVRLSKILGLQKNLELALATTPVRIEAPIPGKALVGIEVPNTAKTMVGLGSLLDTDVYRSSPNPLTIGFGRDVSGTPVFANLSKMPHLLIAGATGSGKSVTIHTLINSLLFRNSPDVLKFVMVDPKRVELTLYKNIPHLLTPVITDAKKTILALKWLISEMERRYDVLETHAVRDLQSYHQTILAPAVKTRADDDEELPETMPFIVVVIDELADIMSTYPRELEAGIVRLAQMSRAVGIHLVLSTQRPSVNVITGLIKANIPSRVALQVSSQIDSRTILDTSGAEKLLGAGDMLFLSGDRAKPQRIQSAFISEDEVKAVVKHLRKHNDTDNMSDMELAMEDASSGSSGGFGGDFDDDEDDLYEDARTIVIEAGKASTSYIQRRLRVGYSRAARLMDILEERGVIGPADGSKPREILVDAPDDDYEEEDES